VLLEFLGKAEKSGSEAIWPRYVLFRQHNALNVFKITFKNGDISQIWFLASYLKKRIQSGNIGLIPIRQQGNNQVGAE